MIPVDQRLDPPQLIIGRDQIVHADHLHLPGFLTRPDRERRKRHTRSLAVRPDETSTGS
jgi:hypothetical protein